MSNPFPDAIDSFDVDQVVAAIARGFDVNAPFDHEDHMILSIEAG